MEQINVNFQIKKIELLEINLNHPNVHLGQESVYNFNINIQQRISVEDKTIHVIISVESVHESDQQCHASIKTSCVFLVENLEDFKIANSHKYKLPDQFVLTLNSIAFSTTRGIMFSAFKGTFMHDIVLPIVNPADFILEEQSDN